MAETAVDDGGIRRASTTIAAGTLASRVLGFVNLALLAWVLGQQNQGVNAWSIANTIPANVFALVAGGLTSAVLVPQIVRAAKHADGGQGFINKLLTLGITACLAIALLLTVLVPVIVPLYIQEGAALSSEGLALTIALAYWCMPQVFFYAVYALLGEALNARKVFGPYTWAPVFNNLVLIATFVSFGLLFGFDPAHRDPASWSTEQIVLLAGGATFGIAVQCLVLTLFWKRTGLTFRPDFRWRGVGLRATGASAGWMFGMVVITQVTIVIQTRVASLAGELDASNAVLNTTWLLFMLPHSILALSIATPYFTRMSAHASSGDLGAVRDDLSSSMRVILMLVTGAGAAIGAAALPFGAFFGKVPAEVVGISSVLIAYLVGLVPYSAMFVLQRGFFSLGDTRTPFLIKVLQGVTVTGILVAVALLAPAPWIAVGVALATSVASTVQAVVLALVLSRRLGGLDGARVMGRIAVFVVAALLAAAGGSGVLALLGGFSGGFAVASTGSAFVSIAVIGLVTLALYGALLLVFRVPELRSGLAPVLRRLRRG